MPTAESIAQVVAALPGLCSKAGHSEIYGIDLSTTSDPVKLIAGKYLKAHNEDVQAAINAIGQTLLWRKEFRPRAAAFEESHDSKFDGLGYITKLDDEIVTWNIYGAAAKNPAALFEPLDKFLRWRIGLQERSTDLLNLKNYVGDGLIDTKQGIQVHDYLNVSFFRMDPTAKAGSKATIDLMTNHYPETMKRKFFVNVPVVMGWMFSAMRLVLSKETMKKFTVLSWGSQLAVELGHAAHLPKEYGGSAEVSLKDIAEPWSVKGGSAEATASS